MINTIDIRLSTSNFFLRSKFERVKVNYGVRLRCARFAHCNFCYRVQLTLPKHGGWNWKVIAIIKESFVPATFWLKRKKDYRIKMILVL